MTMFVQPWRLSPHTMALPINPAPPVTRTRLFGQMSAVSSALGMFRKAESMPQRAHRLSYST